MAATRIFSIQCLSLKIGVRRQSIAVWEGRMRCQRFHLSPHGGQFKAIVMLGMHLQHGAASPSMVALPRKRCWVSECAGTPSVGSITRRSGAVSLSSPAHSSQAFAEPSVTGEDVEQYENDLMAREHVLRYLQAEGIRTIELEDVVLPPSVKIMKERVTFLKKIGLTVKDINGYPLMVGCSVKKNLVPVLDYLEKLHVEPKNLPQVIRKYPMILNASVTMDLEPVLDFLLGIGVDKSNLGKVLTRYPDLLGFKIEGTMSTSIAYLVSIGVNMREIGPMITEYPEILGMRVGNNIKPKVEYLLGLGIPKEVLSKVLEVKPFILGFDLNENIRAAVNTLQELGVREKSIPGMIIQYADILGVDIKHRLNSKMGWLSSHAGVRHEDVSQVLEKLPQILAINLSLAESRVEFLRDAGFSLQDVGLMVAKCPQILAVSVDDILKPGLEFFVKEMQRPLKELVDFPSYFTYSLEKRIRPRYSKILEKGVSCSLNWFLNCSDARFEERLLVEYVESPEDNESIFVL